MALVTHVEFSIPDAGFAIDEVPVPMFLDRGRGSGGGMSAIPAGFRGRGSSGGGGGAVSGLIRRARLVPAPPLSTNARLNLAWKLPVLEGMLSRPLGELRQDPVPLVVTRPPAPPFAGLLSELALDDEVYGVGLAPVRGQGWDVHVAFS